MKGPCCEMIHLSCCQVENVFIRTTPMQQTFNYGGTLLFVPKKPMVILSVAQRQQKNLEQKGLFFKRCIMHNIPSDLLLFTLLPMV